MKFSIYSQSITFSYKGDEIEIKIATLLHLPLKQTTKCEVFGSSLTDFVANFLWNVTGPKRYLKPKPIFKSIDVSNYTNSLISFLIK